MKNLLKLLSLFLLFFMINNATAQTVAKFGHVNTQRLLQQMPEVQTAQQEMERYQKQLENQLRALNQEYERKLTAYQEQIETMSQALRKDRERELIQLQERIQTFRAEAQEEIMKKEQSLLEPILSRVERAIRQVAQENGFAYIFDTSTGAVLYAQESDDVTELVKRKLNL